MKKNRIISNSWDPVTGRGLITVSYDGAEYTYDIDDKYYYSKIVEMERGGRRWLQLLKTFHCVNYARVI